MKKGVYSLMAAAANIVTNSFQMFAISGDSFKEIKDRAKTLYEEISDTEYGGSVTEMPIRDLVRSEEGFANYSQTKVCAFFLV
jgi:hypothetical protein